MIKTSPQSYVSNTILTEDNLLRVIQSHRDTGKRIGLCSGSFDLLHPGHITHLNSAKTYCDILVVGVAGDSYNSQTRGGKGRPIFNQCVRAFAVSQLKSVDYVIVEDNSVRLINLLKPEVYIKGSDYIGKNIIELPAVSRIGAVICYTPDEKLATTEIIRYIKYYLEL